MKILKGLGTGLSISVCSVIGLSVIAIAILVFPFIGIVRLIRR